MKPIKFTSNLSVFALLFCITAACGDNKKKQLNNLLPHLNRKFSFLILDKGSFSIVDKTEPPFYVITVLTKDKVSFPFKRQQYYFPKNSVGGGKDKVGQFLQQVCNLVDSTYMKDDKVFNILRKSKTKIAFEKAGFSIEQDINTGDFLAEILVLFKNLYDFKFKKIRIYIKGYADYSKKYWAIQKEENGIYRKFQVHPALKTGNQMLFYSDVLEERIAKSDTFRNSDLPNLRAAYLKEILDTMIAKYVSDNDLYNDWKVEILDGSVVGEEPDPSQRRGEVIVEIFE